jgi:tRNA nucleotidyltransferase (CCA-adding enzyme)
MDIKSISRERIEAEFEKLFLKSKRPSLGIRWLRDIGRLNDVLPELASTIDVPQEYAWHPEGDVFEHSMQALDAAVPLPYEGKLKLVMMYASLCHDLGKATTTRQIDGKWRSNAHDQAGVPLTKSMLKRITHNQELIAMVVKLVRHHMAPGIFVKQGAKPAAYKRLAVWLAPDVSMQMLADLAVADKSARNGKGHEPLTDPLPDIQEFMKRSDAAQVLQDAQPAVLLGRDLLHLIPPGPKMGVLLKKAYEIQIEEDVHDKEELLRRILEN